MIEYHNIKTVPTHSTIPYKLKIPAKKLMSCPKCRSDAFRTKVGDGSIPHFQCINDKCNFCDRSSRFISVSESRPLGSITALQSFNNPPDYTVIEKRRAVSQGVRKRASSDRRFIRGDDSLVPTEDPIPKLGNMIDTELEGMLKDRPGIILNIVDDIPDNEIQHERYSDNYSDSD